MRIVARPRLLAVLFWSVAWGSSLPGAPPPDSARPRNVLVLITDQHHAAALGCAGDPVVKTPHLDRLAAGGTRFTRAFVPVPYCSPTRAAMVTGLYPSGLGIGRNINAGDDPLRLREPRQTYLHLLAARGYHCHQLGKWHLGDPAELTCFPEGRQDEEQPRAQANQRRRAAGKAGLDAGPRPGEAELIGDVYLPTQLAQAHRQWSQEKGTPKQDVGVIGRSRVKPELRNESVLADYCIALIERHRDEPFAITYSVSPPHAPWVAPAPYYDMYDPQSLPLPATWTDRPLRWQNSASARMGQIYGQSGFREYLRCYYAQVTMMDACIGRILKALDDLGLTARTLVIFTSDHGNMLGQHGMMDKTHGDFYDDLMRVPLLMRLPGVIPVGRVSDAMASSVDIAPTILDYLDAPRLAETHGRSLRRALDGNGQDDRPVFGQRNEPNSPQAARMIRTRQWKLCLFPGGEKTLYDMLADPGELHDLSADPKHADVLRALTGRLREHMRAIGDPAASRLAKEP